MAADEAAANEVAGAASAQQTVVAERIQVHARVLSRLAEEAPGTGAEGRLRLAAQRAFALALRLNNGDQSEPGPKGPVDPANTKGSGETPASRPTGTRTAQPSASPLQERERFGVTLTPEIAGYGWQTPGLHGTPAATPGTSGAGSTSGPRSTQVAAPGPKNTPLPTGIPAPGPVPGPGPTTDTGGPQETPSGSGGPSAPATPDAGGSGSPQATRAGPGASTDSAASGATDAGSGGGRDSGGK
jgi:hypothetical protein